MKHEKALADLKRFAEMFSGIIALAQDMRDVGSVEQAAEEANRRAKDAAKKEEQALEALETIKRDMATYEAEIAELKQSAQAELSAMRQKAIQIDSDARQRAFEVEEAGKATAEKAYAAAAARADSIISAATAEATKHSVLRRESEAEFALEQERAGTALALIQADIVKAEASLARITAEIEALKRKFA